MHAEMVLGAGAFRTVSLAIDSRDGINAMSQNEQLLGGLYCIRGTTHTPGTLLVISVNLTREMLSLP